MFFFTSILHSTSPTSICMWPKHCRQRYANPLFHSIHIQVHREEKQPRSLGQTRREVLECFWALGKSRRRGPLFLILSCGHVKKKKKQPFFCCSFSWGSTTVHTNYHPYFRAGPIFFVSHCRSAIQPDRRKNNQKSERPCVSEHGARQPRNNNNCSSTVNTGALTLTTHFHCQPSNRRFG